MSKLRHGFTVFAKWAAWATGHPLAFVLALTVVIVWAILGPIFGFSDTWQLVINTGTTIVTFLMVFLIQNTQNRDAVALHLKLDELLRAIEGAREDKFMDLEEQSDEVVQEVKQELIKEAAPIVAAQETIRQQSNDDSARAQR